MSAAPSAIGGCVSQDAIVTEIVGESLVGLALRRYASSLASAGSQLGKVGVGHASTAAMGAASTVAQKLTRCPIVERVLWLDTAEGVTRNVIEPTLARHRHPELACERREVIDVLFEFDFNWRRMQSEARRLQRTECYSEQWSLMVCEVSACCAEDPAFEAWVIGRT